jgi:hypothetical protein
VYFRIVPLLAISPRSPKSRSYNPLLQAINDDNQHTASSAGSVGEEDEKYITRMLRQMERSPSMDSITQLHVDQIDKPPPVQV